ncbi:PLP-dependent aminotransferase family protein [Saccharopolyspora sp. K220]|uniref:aminotransferase-like domain-containing protein n=1 Tax=Saccharopolyspora soli TaxID=2926618 RepID=UPI001F55F3AE|nr:PLP-dependent aminotransferase family protein [Saccharopolyspora soli]MCI2418578.1 PLP-dependent aminotransferase family protein [Saccharopolyspora soli]
MPSGDVDQFAALIRDRLRHGHGPLSRRLAAALTDLARTGALSPGTRLPSERDLARVLDCSRGAVAAAFNALFEDGVCERRHGSGTYLAAGAGPESAMGRLLRPGAVFADLSTSVVPDPSHLRVPKLDPADLLRTPSQHGYDLVGEPGLRELLGDEVLITGGAQQGIDLATRCLARPGDAVLVEKPTYPGALAAIQGCGARAVAVATDHRGMRPDALRDAISRYRPAFGYVQAVRNPDGAVADDDRVGELAETARHADLRIVEDRTLAELVYEGARPGRFAATHPHGTIEVHSLSKVLWGGLRVGWLAAPEPLLAQLTELKQTSDLATSAVSQRLAAELLRHNDFASWRTELAQRRDHLSAALHRDIPQWTWDRPLGGLSLWVRLPGTDTDRFAELARGNGVAVAPGSLFSADRRYRDHLRLSFALSPELLDQAVAALARTFRSKGHRAASAVTDHNGDDPGPRI